MTACVKWADCRTCRRGAALAPAGGSARGRSVGERSEGAKEGTSVAGSPAAHHEDFGLEIAGDRERTVAVRGMLSGAAAAKLERALADIGRADRVVLDLSLVRDFSDFGLAVLARALVRRPPSAAPVAIRGLRQHQLRMFRYLGLDLGDGRRREAGHS